MMENQSSTNSQAIQAHLQILQTVIQRMASNSAYCKAWCITLVSAMLVIVADKGKPQFTLIAIIPAVLFLILDAYYLALEKAFRNSYNGFIDKLSTGKLTVQDMYAVVPSGKLGKLFFASLTSFSIWPFYLTLLGMIWATMKII